MRVNRAWLRRGALAIVATIVPLGVGPVSAYSSGIHENSFNSSGCNQSGCHSGGNTPTVTIFNNSGSTQYVEVGETGCYYVRISQPSGATRAGFNASINSTQDLTTGGSYSSGTKTITSSGEVDVTHTAKASYSGGFVRKSFCWTPTTHGTFTITAWGNAVNNDGSTPGDRAASDTHTVYGCRDNDGDGFYSSSSPSGCPGATDCNDNNQFVYPGRTEICNNINDDCDGSTDEGCDNDNDNYCDSNMTVVGTPSTCTFGGGDCNDTNFNINPGRTEICNNINDNCTGGTDEGCDNDNDNYCDSNMTVVGTPSTCTAGGGDCNDTNFNINPGRTEICNNINDNCTGGTDEGCDDDNDNYCDSNMTVVGTPSTCTNGGGDCDDEGAGANLVNPGATEICNGINDNCTGGTDEGCDDDNDNYCDSNMTVVGTPPTCTDGGGDCNDTNGNINPGETEVCNGINDNCSGGTDEGCDDDGDDYCDANMTTVGTPSVCPNGGGDCDDDLGVTYPGAPEICDGLDNDCDNPPVIDENIGTVTCGLGICENTASGCVNGVPQNCVPNPPGKESCSNLATDDDCDGDATELIDDVHAGDFCNTGQPGICAAGTRACSGGALVCNPDNSPESENCGNQGVDNDCDGDATEIGNGIHVGDPCTSSALGACRPGTYQCDGTVRRCVPVLSPVAETCQNLGVDNDCDGNADELTDGVEQGDPCTTGQPGECSAGLATCGGGVFVCQQINSPTAEVCDGLDNDCNNSIDDGLPDLTCGVGGCERTVPACAGGADNTCTPGQPVAEECDDIDNDCDGTTDNGCDDDNDDYCDDSLTLIGTPAVCPNGGGDCDDTTSATNPGAEESCDGIDNDCNGPADDNITTPKCGVGECVSEGTACVNGMATNCTPKAPTAEVCDGLDNDCDGVNDNGVPLSTCGVGECARQGTTCFQDSCTEGAPAAEVCDGLDNDCDGVNDNGIPLSTCGVGECTRQGTTCDASSCAPGTPVPEVCDGKDNDCNGLPDDGLPLATCGAGACAAVGDSCLPSSCTPGVPTDEACDGIDNDCDGVVDNGCDDDGDGYCDLQLDYIGSPECPNGGGDCDDDFAETNPAAPELCDGKDNNCNAQADEGVVEPSCGVGACKALGTDCVDGAATDCTPGTPSAETCDGVDNDCNGLIDDGIPNVQCGEGACRVELVGCLNGVAPTCTPVDPTAEVCDGVDNDCDGQIDNGDLCDAGATCIAGACQRIPGQGGSGGQAGSTSVGGSGPGGSGSGATSGVGGVGGDGRDGGASAGGGQGGSPAAGGAPAAGTSGSDSGSGDDSGCGCKVIGAGSAPTSPNSPNRQSWWLVLAAAAVCSGRRFMAGRGQLR